MNLREYLFHNNISVKDFADKLAYSRTHISLIVNGLSNPSKRLAKAIELATNGEVKADSFSIQKPN